MLADVPAASLSDDAPLYDRPRRAPRTRRRRRRLGAAHRVRRRPARPAALAAPGSTASTTTSSSSTPWPGPGADAALLRLAGPGLPPSNRGRGGDHRLQPPGLCARPAPGTALVLAEGVANLACVGATPAAVVNCLNFGNPEHPEVMWQLSECIDGMAEACRALSLPVIGGNVSLYNESGGADIDPTPVLGVLGLVDAVHAPPPGLAWSDGDTVVLLGPRTAQRDGVFPLEGTRWATERADHRSGRRPARRLRGARRVVRLRRRAGRGAGGARCRRPAALVHAVHDVSGGGLAVALAEMAAAAGIGCAVDVGDTRRALHGAALALRGGHGGPATTWVPGRPRWASPRRSWAGRGATGSPLGSAARPPGGGRVRGPRGESRSRPWANRDGAGLCENG